MSNKSDGSSSSDLHSRKWRTDFKELGDPVSLPTYFGDEFQHHTPPSSSSLGDDNPLKELQQITKGNSTESIESAASYHDPERMSGDRQDAGHGNDTSVSTLPLDIDNPSVYREMPGEVDVSLQISVEECTSSEGPDRSPTQITSNVDPTTNNVIPNTLQLSSQEEGDCLTVSSEDLSLGKIESKPVVAEVEEDSLDLFLDVRKRRSRPPAPPRPPKPQVSVTETTEAHPLMLSNDPDPDLEFFGTFYTKGSAEQPKSGLSAKFSKTAGFINRKRGKSPVPKSDEGDKSLTPSAPVSKSSSASVSKSPSASVSKGEMGSQGEDVAGSVASKDTVSVVSSEGIPSNTPSRKQKFKAMRNQFIGKAYSKYSQYYDYYYSKNNKQLRDNEVETPSQRSRVSSESSEGGFYEITSDDIAVIPEPTPCDEPQSDEVGDENPVLDDLHSSSETVNTIPGVSQLPTEATPTVATTPIEGGLSHRVLGYLYSLYYQKQIVYSFMVGLLSVLLYITIYYSNTFMQGFIIGTLSPTVLVVVVFILTHSSKPDSELETQRVIMQVSRLRKLGSASSLKDFFQYTETHNFGELRTKSIPYRYFKLKGSVIEAYELNATKEQVSDPLKLSVSEIKSYGLKPIFKADISGWLVSIEAPPGSKVTASSMWKKRYPIWVRKRRWRTEVSEYEDEQTVNSFYLISPYSRYKEQWYEALRKAVRTANLSEQNDLSKMEADNYREFMETLFNDIPGSVASEENNPRNGDVKRTETEGEIQSPESSSKSKDMQHSAWINALFGRFVWNILNDIKWENRIKDRIVRKLSSVSTRHVSSLELKSFDLGNTVPLITNTHLPKVDHQGVWSEMELEWSGQVSLSLVARLNTKSTGQGDNSKSFEPMKLESERAAEQANPGKLAKLYKLFEKIEIGVCAKVTRVAGRLCVNIPPPPTDCVWYGFTEPPELKIHLTPILGRWISLDYKPITNALEKQLQSLFNETFVLPAMENVVLPGMSRDLLTKQDLPDTLDMCQLLDQAPSADTQELLDVAGGGVQGDGGGVEGVKDSSAI